MSVEQIDKIDVISNTPNGKVELTIADHLEWNDEENHLLILQEKLNSYLDFVESGQILKDYPNAINKEIVISVVMKYTPTKKPLIFLSDCEKFMQNAGFEFKWEVAEE
jgi:hypothetical protein